MVEAQCNYHTQAKDLFQTIKNNWGQGSNADPSNMMETIIARSNSVQSFHSMSSNQKQHLQQRKSYHFTPESNSSSSSNSINTTLNEEIDNHVPIRSPLPQHVPPSRRSTQEFIKYRKALFEFNSTNTDEISFKVGDIISVIDEIDKGWWLGEVHSKKGIFPVNYTEDYDPQTQPLPPLPPPSGEQTPVVQSVNVASLNTTVRSRPPPPPSSISSPVINNIGVSRTKSTAIRPPPPPPSSAVRHNSLDSSPVLQPNNHTTTILSQNLIHHEPTSYHNEDLSSIRSNSPTTNLETTEPIPCHECECQLQVPNLFKKGFCNNCFHKHRIVQQ